MKTILKNYFTFNRRDKNAFLILIFILFIVIIIPIIHRLAYKEEICNYGEYRKELLDFELEQNKMKEKDSLENLAQKEKFNFLHIDNSVENVKLTPFLFNPNNLPAEQWRKMGLSENQINGIKNFEAKGGRFYIKSDFKKLYVISDNEYNILEPFIDLPETSIKKKATKVFSDTITLIELNSADSTTLKTIKGIGNAISKRIVWYREKLGGFCKKEQLLEVSGIDTVLYKTIEPYFSLEKRMVKQMDINTIDFMELKKHPYLSSNVALSIINYRNMHGNYQSLADIMKSALVTEELFYKIAPYISIN